MLRSSRPSHPIANAPSGGRRRWCSLATLRIAFLLLTFANAGSVNATTVMRVATTSDAEITLESWLGSTPSTGMLPVKVRMTNRTNQPMAWTLRPTDNRYDAGSMNSEFRVGISANASGTADILVPVLPNKTSGRFYGSTLRFNVSGSAISGGSTQVYMATTATAGSSARAGASSTPNAFMAMGDELNSRHGSKLKDQIKAATSRDWLGSEVSMIDAPTDWRGYSSIAQFWLTDSEWNKLSNASRLAVLTWVAHGSSVVVCADAAAPLVTMPSGFTSWTGNSLRHGIGRLQVLNYSSATEAEIGSLVRDAHRVSIEQTSLNQSSKTSSLTDLVPPVTMNTPLIFGFIVIFGVLVGPVNLFVFARGANRPRMFWTTPLISAAGTLVLIAVMILQDGFGGTGARITLATLQPEQKQMTVVQEQFSKTGVLLGRSFEVPVADSVLLLPVSQSREITTRFGSTRTETDKRDYTITPTQASGGFFTSRALQRQIVHSTRSTRGGIDFYEGDKPTLVSSLGMNLKTLYLRDSKGSYWIANNVHTGERTPLKSTNLAEMQQWWTANAKHHCGDLMHARLASSILDNLPWFYAESAEPAKLATPTLTSIRWDNDRAFIAGPYAVGP